MTYETIKLNNPQFISSIFGAWAPRAWVASFTADPNATAPGQWTGGLFGEVPMDNPKANNFVGISSFKPGPDGKTTRTLSCVDHIHLVVVDDVGAKVQREDLAPVNALVPFSYAIQTSPGNEQWGWILHPDPRRWALDQLYSYLAAQGLNDPGCTGATRYCRLPVGCNTKAAYVGVDGVAPSHRLLLWKPRRRYSLEVLAQGVGLRLREPVMGVSGFGRLRTEGAGRASGAVAELKPDKTLDDLEAWGLVKGEKKPGVYDITCPWVDEHTHEADNGAAYFAPGAEFPDGSQSLHGGFKCWHAHCEGRGLKELRAWLKAKDQNLVAGVYEEGQGLAELMTKDENPLDRFRITDWATRKPSPRTWLFQDSFMLGSEGVLFGDGGSGKSRLAYQAAVGVVLGMPVAGVLETPNPGAVLYVCPEDDREEMHRRFEEILAVVDSDSDMTEESCVDRARLYENLYIERGIMPDGENRLTCFEGGALSESEAVNYLILIASKIKDLRLIILDPLASFMAGDENSTECMTMLIKALRTVSQALGHEVNVLLVHHSNKAGGTGSQGQHGARGSSALTCGVRWVSGLFGMTEIEAKLHGVAPDDRWQYVRWGLVKTNYSPGQGVIWLRRTGAGGVLQKVVLGLSGKGRGVEDPGLLGQVCRILTEDRGLDVFHSATGFAKLYAERLGVGQKKLKKLIDQGVEARVLTILRGEARGSGCTKMVHVAAWYGGDEE